MSRRVYKWCSQCSKLSLVAGEPRKDDHLCPHRFARIAATPTVYYVNAEGQLWVPPTATDTCPLAGYERREVQPHEVRKFEREMNSRLRREHYAELEQQAEANERAARDREQVRRQLADELREESRHRSPEEREFLEYVLEQSREQVDYSRGYDPNFRIDAYN